MLLAEGVARVRLSERPLVEVSSWPLAILQADQKERKKQILNSTPNWYKGMSGPNKGRPGPDSFLPSLPSLRQPKVASQELTLLMNDDSYL